VTNELDSWARRAALLPAALVDATPEAVRSSAEVLEQAARVNLSVATGGDLRLSRVRSGKGAHINLSVAVRGAGRSAEGVVVPTGPIMLVEQATKRHAIPFVYTYNRRVKKRGNTKVIRIPGGVGTGYATRIVHPGTAGKRPVARAFEQAHEQAGVAGVAVFAAATRRHMGG